MRTRSLANLPEPRLLSTFDTRCVISGGTQEVRKPLFASCFLSVMSPRSFYAVDQTACSARLKEVLLWLRVLCVRVCVSTISVFSILGK